MARKMEEENKKKGKRKMHQRTYQAYKLMEETNISKSCNYFRKLWVEESNMGKINKEHKVSELDRGF